MTPGTPAWMERHERVLACAQRPHDPKFGIVFARGQSSTLWDVDGRDYIDLTCGYSAINFGHSFKPLIDVATAQLGTLQHLTGDAHRWKIELAERLIDSLGFVPVVDPDCERAARVAGERGAKLKVVFNATGARAVETAWKAAISFRPGKILALGPGFHGRSIATGVLSDLDPASAATSVSLVRESASLIWNRDDYPYCERCPLGKRYPSCGIACASGLEHYLASHATEISAILVEPALGARGYIFPPDEFFRRLRRIAHAHGILLIADEIQTGLGRCGAMLLSTSQGWQPDLTIIGKSLGGGIVPISACIGPAEILDRIPSGSESETFAGTPFACAIALEVLRQLAGTVRADCSAGRHGERLPPQTDWIDRGSQLGRRLRSSVEGTLRQAISAGRAVVSGRGANCTIEFCPGEVPLIEAHQHAKRFAQRCCERGVLAHLSGPNATRVVLLPAFTMTEEELQAAQVRLHAAWQSAR